MKSQVAGGHAILKKKACFLPFVDEKSTKCWQKQFPLSNFQFQILGEIQDGERF